MCRIALSGISKGRAMSDVIVVIGPGQIGQAIARRVGVGKQIVLADLRLDTATAAAAVLLPVDERRSLRA